MRLHLTSRTPQADQILNGHSELSSPLGGWNLARHYEGFQPTGRKAEVAARLCETHRKTPQIRVLDPSRSAAFSEIGLHQVALFDCVALSGVVVLNYYPGIFQRPEVPVDGLGGEAQLFGEEVGVIADALTRKSLQDLMTPGELSQSAFTVSSHLHASSFKPVSAPSQNRDALPGRASRGRASECLVRP